MSTPIWTPVPIVVLPVMLETAHPMPTLAVPVVMPMVPKMVNGVPDATMSLGASLRDRATLPSPLRGLGPSGGYPSRLRSLRSLRAPLAAAVRCAHRRCRDDTPLPRFDGVVPVTVVSSSRRRCAPRSSRCSLRSPWTAAPAAGNASARRGGTSCTTGPGFAVHRLAHHPAHRRLRSCARSCGTLRARRSAPRPAVASAQVRTAPPPPPAACCARLPAAPPAPPATHSPWRLPSAGFAGVDSPVALPRIHGCLYALRRFGFTPDASLMQRLP